MTIDVHAYMDSVTASSSKYDEKEDTVVTEIPPALDKLLLLMVKNFYSREQFILVYYIMRAICIKEEHLRARIHFDHKQMRTWLAQLKGDKIIRERLIQQKNANNRNVTMIFYFINYRALLNVLTYKIDHMRQRLEAREKDSVQKAHYKCTKCTAQYETLEMDRIIDPMTGNLVCWRCRGEVELDQSTGPTIETRSLLAKFNEQMLPMFTVIRELAGIQLAPHLYEPDINKYLDDPIAEAEAQQQLLDFSSKNDSQASLGGKAFNKEAGNRSNLASKETIIVDLNAGVNVVAEEMKAVPTWLTDAAIGNESTAVHSGLGEIADLETAQELPIAPPTVDLSMLAELEGLNENVENSKPKNTSNGENMEKEKESESESEEDEPMLSVKGQMFALSDITPEMVEDMSDQERSAYVQAVQDNMDY